MSFSRLHRHTSVTASPDSAPLPMLARLTHVITRHRWLVIGIWIVLTLFGQLGRFRGWLCTAGERGSETADGELGERDQRLS